MSTSKKPLHPHNSVLFQDIGRSRPTHQRRRVNINDAATANSADKAATAFRGVKNANRRSGGGNQEERGQRKQADTAKDWTGGHGVGRFVGGAGKGNGKAVVTAALTRIIRAVEGAADRTVSTCNNKVIKP